MVFGWFWLVNLFLLLHKFESMRERTVSQIVAKRPPSGVKINVRRPATTAWLHRFADAFAKQSDSFAHRFIYLLLSILSYLFFFSKG